MREEEGEMGIYFNPGWMSWGKMGKSASVKGMGLCVCVEK